MTLIVSLILTPFIAALCSFLFVKNRVLLNFLAIISAVLELLSMAGIVYQVYATHESVNAPLVSIDPLGAFVLFITVVVGFFATWYSVGYLNTELQKGIIDSSRIRHYFSLFHLFLGAMIVAIVTNNSIIMWIAIEATTLSTTFLISFYNKSSAVEAAWKYLVINSLGLLLAFFGTLLFFTAIPKEHIIGFVDWNTLVLSAHALNPFIVKIAFIFVLIGYGTKVGLAPMHTWLPDAHSKAPAPISALLSGALLNIALLALLRFKIITDTAIGIHFSQKLLILFGLVSIIISVFIIFVQKKYKRLLAYSSIEHMGIMALGFGFGGIGSFAALIHMMYHSFAKSLLFFSSGSIYLKYGLSKISNIQGMASSMPFTACVFFCGFLAITGVPPFGTFMTEFMILYAGMAHYPIISFITLVFLILVFAGFLRHIVAMVWSAIPESLEKGEIHSKATLFSLAVLTFLLFFISIVIPDQLQSLAHNAAIMIR